MLNQSCYVVLGLNWPLDPSLIPGRLELQLSGWRGFNPPWTWGKIPLGIPTFLPLEGVHTTKPCHKILPRAHLNLCVRGKICDINLHWKMTKFLAKGGGLGFWWLAFPIHFWSYFNAPHSFLASESKKVKWFLAQGEIDIKKPASILIFVCFFKRFRSFNTVNIGSVD